MAKFNKAEAARVAGVRRSLVLDVCRWLAEGRVENEDGTFTPGPNRQMIVERFNLDADAFKTFVNRLKTGGIHDAAGNRVANSIRNKVFTEAVDNGLSVEDATIALVEAHIGINAAGPEADNDLMEALNLALA